jgi:hypothetical protein
MRFALYAAGIILIANGALWIGQGTGRFPYPSYSFMINDMTWAYIGAATLAVGVAFILLARRRP